PDRSPYPTGVCADSGVGGRGSGRAARAAVGDGMLVGDAEDQGLLPPKRGRGDCGPGQFLLYGRLPARRRRVCWAIISSSLVGMPQAAPRLSGRLRRGPPTALPLTVADHCPASRLTGYGQETT